MTEEHDDLLSQADALMRRHRSFIARPPEPAAAPSAASEEAELPLLTDIVATETLDPQDEERRLAELEPRFTEILSAWLAEALPLALNRAHEALGAELTTQAREKLLPRLLELLAERPPRLER
ncbi:MAG: hypothetical protein N3C63_07145 [Rhodocyclaceae bacterium]|nr:hypothetical protein [Rhodocyclaceae bacterium]